MRIGSGKTAASSAAKFATGKVGGEVHAWVANAGKSWLLMPKGVVVDPKSVVVDPKGVVVDPKGVVVDPKGVVIDPKGVVVDPKGEVIDASRHHQARFFDHH